MEWVVYDILKWSHEVAHCGLPVAGPAGPGRVAACTADSAAPGVAGWGPAVALGCWGTAVRHTAGTALLSAHSAPPLFVVWSESKEKSWCVMNEWSHTIPPLRVATLQHYTVQWHTSAAQYVVSPPLPVSFPPPLFSDVLPLQASASLPPVSVAPSLPPPAVGAPLLLF